MGCFSFLCKNCGRPILSNSFSGEKVKLFLLKNGVVQQSMEGEYDSYGKVFTHNKKHSIEWDMDWNEVCDLMFHDNISNGMAAIHSRCFIQNIPNTRSEDDPDQGWGNDGWLMDDFNEERFS